MYSLRYWRAEKKGEIVRKSKLFILALAFVMIFALALTGCNDDNGYDDPANDVATNDAPGVEGAVAGGTFRMYINEPQHLDPYNAGESEGLHVLHAIFNPLVRPGYLDPTEIVPAAATGYSVNEDATEFTFYLLPDGRFADGTPVTADDFIFAWNRIVHPETTSTLTGDVDPGTIFSQLAAVEGFDAVRNGDADELTGLSAPDDHTLVVTLSHPFADFIMNVMHGSLGPVPRDLVENGVEFEGETVPFGLMPIGNGPFMMEEPWARDQFIHVTQNPYYTGPFTPYLDRIEFRIFSDMDAAFMEFNAGGLDYTDISIGQFQTTAAAHGLASNGYTANPGERVIGGAQAGTYFIIMNTQAYPTDNPDVRRAITLAIDRDAINDLVWEGAYTVAGDFLPPGIPGHDNTSWADSRFDPEAAAQALADAGYPGGEGFAPITLSFNAGAGHEEIMEIVQSNLADIGIEAVFDGMEWGTYLEMIDAGNFQIGRLGWMASYPSPHYFLWEIFDSEAGNNFSQFENAEVDAAMAAATKLTGDGAEIAAAWQEISAMIGDHNPVVPVAFYAHRIVTSERVNNVTVSPLNNIDFSNIWIAEDQQ